MQDAFPEPGIDDSSESTCEGLLYLSSSRASEGGGLGLVAKPRNEIGKSAIMVNKGLLRGLTEDTCCSSSCERRIMEEDDEQVEEKIEEEVGGCSDGELSDRSGGGGWYYQSTSCSAALQLSSLPMATTPPLSPEHLQRGEARCRADFGRSNTWERIAAAGLYAVSLWKFSQEMIEEKTKILTDGPSGKLKEDRERYSLTDIR